MRDPLARISAVMTPQRRQLAGRGQVRNAEGGYVFAKDLWTQVEDFLILGTSRVTPGTNLREIAGWRPSGAGTDLSLPFSWALRQGLAVAGILVFTDNETWAGRQHPVQALEAYRRAVNPAVRVVAVSLTPVGYSIGDHGDEGVLAVAGLHPDLIARF